MKVYVNKSKTKEMWYDPHLRSWVMEDQKTWDCYYTVSKTVAMEWLHDKI